MKSDLVGVAPPAIVRTARRSLAECAEAANAAVKKSEAGIIEIGRALLEAKAQLDRGEWLPWLTENFRASLSTAKRAIRAALKANVVVDGEILDGFDAPIDCDSPAGGTAATTPAKSQIGPVSGPQPSANIVYCRPCRTTGVKPNCPECERVRAAKIGLFDQPHHQNDATLAAPESTQEAPEEKPESELPERVRAALAAVPAFRECVDLLTEVQAKVIRLRESPGGWHVPVELLGDMCRAIQAHIWDNRPEAACDACNGNGCSLCDSQGWLSAKTHNEIIGTKS